MSYNWEPFTGREPPEWAWPRVVRPPESVGVTKMRQKKGRGEHEDFSGVGLRKAGPRYPHWGVAR